MWSISVSVQGVSIPPSHHQMKLPVSKTNMLRGDTLALKPQEAVSKILGFWAGLCHEPLSHSRASLHEKIKALRMSLEDPSSNNHTERKTRPPWVVFRSLRISSVSKSLPYPPLPAHLWAQAWMVPLRALATQPSQRLPAAGLKTEDKV